MCKEHHETQCILSYEDAPTESNAHCPIQHPPRIRTSNWPVILPQERFSASLCYPYQNVPGLLCVFPGLVPPYVIHKFIVLIYCLASDFLKTNKFCHGCCRTSREGD